MVKVIINDAHTKINVKENVMYLIINNNLNRNAKIKNLYIFVIFFFNFSVTKLLKPF